MVPLEPMWPAEAQALGIYGYNIRLYCFKGRIENQMATTTYGYNMGLYGDNGK